MVRPSGLLKSEAILATDLFGATPTEQVSLAFSFTSCFIFAASRRGFLEAGQLV